MKKYILLACLVAGQAHGGILTFRFYITSGVVTNDQLPPEIPGSLEQPDYVGSGWSSFRFVFDVSDMVGPNFEYSGYFSHVDCFDDLPNEYGGLYDSIIYNPQNAEILSRPSVNEACGTYDLSIRNGEVDVSALFGPPDYANSSEFSASNTSIGIWRNFTVREDYKGLWSAHYETDDIEDQSFRVPSAVPLPLSGVGLLSALGGLLLLGRKRRG
ncbi:hypothetical protein ACMA5I_05445 [Paracoccaceae bacterium GXU_MW_L88]